MKKHTISLEETWLDFPSPEGNAVAIIMTGCEHNCKGCHSLSLQIFKKYEESFEEMLMKIKNFAERANTNKLVFLGGDPLFFKNQELTKYLTSNLKGYDICIFTGYDIEFVKKLTLENVKYYKCGKFDKNLSRLSKKTDSEYILASENQNFYDSEYNLISNKGILYFNNEGK